MTLDLALKQIEFARSYTLAILSEIDEADWFQMPPGCVCNACVASMRAAGLDPRSDADLKTQKPGREIN